jgi:hypothetical protein
MEKQYILFGQRIPTSSLILGAVGLLSMCLVFFVIIPQLSAISDLRNQIATKNTDVATLKQSLSNINAVPEGVLNDDYTAANEALPSNKNIIAVFSRVNQIALDSDAALSGFTLKLGDLYSKSKKKSPLVPQNGTPVIDISVSLAVVDKASIAKFIDLVYKSLPVARVNSVSSDASTASIEMSFYYKPYDLEKIQQTNEVQQYQQTGADTLQKVKGWESK